MPLLLHFLFFHLKTPDILNVLTFFYVISYFSSSYSAFLKMRGEEKNTKKAKAEKTIHTSRERALRNISHKKSYWETQFEKKNKARRSCRVLFLFARRLLLFESPRGSIASVFVVVDFLLSVWLIKFYRLSHQRGDDTNQKTSWWKLMTWNSGEYLCYLCYACINAASNQLSGHKIWCGSDELKIGSAS